MPASPAPKAAPLNAGTRAGRADQAVRAHPTAASGGTNDATGIAEDRKGWLFRTARGHNGSVFSEKPMSQPDAWRMIRRRAIAAGIAEAIGCHTFRATGITAYLANGGALEL